MERVSRAGRVGAMCAARRQLHPDKQGQGEGAGERTDAEFATLHAAYETLGDPVRRAQYDAHVTGADRACASPVTAMAQLTQRHVARIRVGP